ncbi:MAG: DUF3467 domain-containing protein [Desulfobacula sp.]|jgi:hypothetical protein|uniref:DUF3467 domain-containing protein n=1 Tax=Desulfobacula sp. TaxID=2593537 RepID=UPI001D8F92D3|nr:DUF3467 domain-containing protein [Desulfobacula sp.]MBT3807855.1 DUF3467 domain-containing protein [Desulfobacula sp.]MBT6341626.1 DUF3467 domain-containing protein [Desulfobacula sp.]
MTEKSQKSKGKKETPQQPEIQFHVPPELEYVYRDIFNVYAGVGDVTIEFGNHHKAMPEHASISNRIVMTVGNAYILVQTLQEALQKAQAALQHGLKNQKGE